MNRDKRLLKLKKVCKEGVEKYGARFKIGLGCIATGISGTEPLLSPQELAEDLYMAKENKVSEAIIFRSGGLTEDYIKAIQSVLS